MKGSQLNISDAIIGNPAEMNYLERAIWNSRQGLMSELGIQSKTALALAPLRLNSQYTGACMNVRRSSDNATEDILFRAGKADYNRWRDGLYNCLSNGDGRYGLVGVSATGGTLSVIENGHRNVGATRFQQINHGLSFNYLPSPIGGRFSVKATINAPIGAPSVGIYLANGTDVKVASILPLLTLGQDTEIVVDIPDVASLGANSGNRFYFAVVWNADADAVGKVLEVKNASLIYRGESASRPYYNTPVADLLNTVLAKYTDSKGTVPYTHMTLPTLYSV